MYFICCQLVFQNLLFWFTTSSIRVATTSGQLNLHLQTPTLQCIIVIIAARQNFFRQYKRASHSKNSSALNLEQLWQTILSLSMRANHKARAAAADDDESAKIRPQTHSRVRGSHSVRKCPKKQSLYFSIDRGAKRRGIKEFLIVGFPTIFRL